MKKALIMFSHGMTGMQKQHGVLFRHGVLKYCVRSLGIFHLFSQL
jgi:hypothetical protein